MLSKRLYKIFGIFGNVTSYFGVLPVSWCPTRKIVVACPRARKLTIFQLIRFRINSEFDNFNIVLLYGFVNWIALQMFSTLVYKEMEAIDFANSMLFYLKYMNRKLIHN